MHSKQLYCLLLTIAFLTQAIGCAEQPDSEPTSAEDVAVRTAQLTAADCPPGSNIIIGTNGDDVIVGTDLDDCIVGLNGDDVLIGGAGNDFIIGGNGDDTLEGGEGDDALYGENGSDRLVGGDGNDLLLGDKGADTALGEAGNDVISGGQGRDTIEGGEGNDVLNGGRGADSLQGDEDDDVIVSDRNDVVDGGAGQDQCSGVRCEAAPRLCAAAAQCGLCEDCVLGGCASQPAGSDLKDECPASECGSGACDGSGACFHFPSGDPCGSAADTECTDPDTCDGAGTCLTNDAPSGALCGDGGTECIVADRCDGAGTCVDHGFFPAGQPCGDPSATACDAADTCDGSGVCNANPQAFGAPCGSTSDTECTNPDFCNGAGICLADYEPPGAGCGFDDQSPTSAATVDSVAETCNDSAELPGTIPSGYTPMPAELANCTEHPPQTLLDYSLWDGIDLSATPGYDVTRTCWRLQWPIRQAARDLAALEPLFGDGGNLPLIRSAVIDHFVMTAARFYWSQPAHYPHRPNPDFGPAYANAMADVAVTGRNAYVAFSNTRPTDSATAELSRRVTVAAVRERLTAEAPGHAPLSADIEAAIRDALDRAYSSLWAIRGPVATRATLRPTLGYIAVAGDEDPPHRPVNVYSPDLSPAPAGSDLPDLEVHQQNAVYSVPFRRNGLDTDLRVETRYLVIVDADEALETRRPQAFDLRTPPEDDWVVVPADHDYIVLIHGHSSRAEEAMDIARPLIAEWRRHGRKLAVIAPDLPSNGYSTMIDHRDVASVLPDGQTVISEFDWYDGSFRAYYPVLEFIEESFVRFVSQLDRAFYRGLADSIRAVIGGSLGGNMGLRLSRRSKAPGTGYPFLKSIVSWSPASTWGDSWARARLHPFDAGTYIDIAKHEAVRVTRDKYRDYDDGIASVDGREERGNRKLEYFVGVFTTSSTIFEAITSGIFPPQGDRWYRDGWPCKTTYLKGAIFDRWEIYNKRYRLWHWRVAHEQLLFMHAEPYRSAGGVGSTRSYEDFETHLMLAAGAEDNHPPDRLYDNTRDLAEKVVDYNDGLATPKVTGETLWLENTGHSIHNERPNYFAGEIWRFLSLPPLGG